jgi:hypothetical protein
MDRGALTTQGFLRSPAFLTRTGVFRYRKKDGTIVRELRHPDDVFHEDAIASLRMAPVTDNHPDDFVTPDNVKLLSVGWISENIEIKDDLIGATAIIADGATIRRVQSGKVELSCGYHADMVQEKGVYNGEEYDCRQTNLRYNHVAIVDRGRAGARVRLRLDAEDAELFDEDEKPGTREDEGVKKIKIDGKEFEVSQEVYDAYTADIARRDAAFTTEQKLRKDAEEKAAKGKGEGDDEEAKKLKALMEKNDQLTAKVDSLTEKLAQKTDSVPNIDAAVQERMGIMKTAQSVLGEDVKLDGKSNLDIMKEVVAKASPKTDMKDKSDVYVRARFDAITEDAEGRDDRRTAFGRPKNDDRKDEDFDSDKARKKSQDAESKRWQEPLASTKK